MLRAVLLFICVFASIASIGLSLVGIVLTPFVFLGKISLLPGTPIWMPALTALCLLVAGILAALAADKLES